MTEITEFLRKSTGVNTRGWAPEATHKEHKSNFETVPRGVQIETAHYGVCPG